MISTALKPNYGYVILKRHPNKHEGVTILLSEEVTAMWEGTIICPSPGRFGRNGTFHPPISRQGMIVKFLSGEYETVQTEDEGELMIVPEASIFASVSENEKINRNEEIK